MCESLLALWTLLAYFAVRYLPWDSTVKVSETTSPGVKFLLWEELKVWIVE